MDLKEQLKSLSAQDRKELLKQLQQEEKESKRNRRDAYEGLRAQFMLEVKNRLLPVVDDVKAFRDWVEKEAAAFRAVMREYGQLRKDEQASFTIVDGDMKLEVRSNKVKSFDERADLAAERLVDYLKRRISLSTAARPKVAREMYDHFAGKLLDSHSEPKEESDVPAPGAVKGSQAFAPYESFLEKIYLSYQARAAE